MTNYSKELILEYNQVFSYYPNYKHFYFDFLNKNLKSNTSVIYSDLDENTNNTILRLGIIVLKDHIIFETKEGITTKITLKSVPFIRTVNGTLKINTGNNCSSV